jgi:A/G-specific adenine glycosylase
MEHFSDKIISWYQDNKRELPWRNTKNAYKIWLSEIILQQTKVAQGLPYYLKFVQHFPDVKSMAMAQEEEVLKLWQGLGYYSRARNLHHTAKEVYINLNGNFPSTYNDLQKLKGIGTYTAAAIASFAYKEVVPVVDGNVFRVLARYFGINMDIAESKTKTYFFELSKNLIPKKNPDTYNQAIMEMGALICTPKNAQCTICPVQNSCKALSDKKVYSYPVKSKKAKPKKRFFSYVILEDKKTNWLLFKREAKDIWQHLYEFYLIENHDIIAEVEIEKQLKKQYNITELISFEKETIIHKLTHQHLHIQFFKAKINDVLVEAIPQNQVKKMPFPIVIHNFLEKIVT